MLKYSSPCSNYNGSIDHPSSFSNGSPIYKRKSLLSWSLTLLAYPSYLYSCCIVQVFHMLNVHLLTSASQQEGMYNINIYIYTHLCIYAQNMYNWWHPKVIVQCQRHHQVYIGHTHPKPQVNICIHLLDNSLMWANNAHTKMSNHPDTT